MGGKRIAERVRRVLIAAAKTMPVVVALAVGCTGESGTGAIPRTVQVCVKVCEKEKSCVGSGQEGRDCEHFCTRRGADASFYLQLGSPGVSSSCSSDEALAKLSACADGSCNDLQACQSCACGDSRSCPPN